MIQAPDQDQETLKLLEAKTTQVEVDGVLRYTTPLLRKKDKEVVIPNLQSTKPRLA